MTSRAESVLHSASSLGRTVDALFLSLLGITGVVAIAVATLIVFFAVRYRAGSKADRSNPPVRARWIEICWTVTPLAIFIGLFVWSSLVFSDFYRPPADAMRIHVLARQWMWKLEHDNGRREINELHVPAGQPVELIMTSQDVIHSFFVPAFRVKQDVLPGRYTSLWFTATRAGRFNLFCAEYCGTDHSNMHGSVVVMQPADFAAWLAATPGDQDLASRGFEIYRRAGCSGCHEATSTVHAPSLVGLFGRTVQLSGGGSLVADDNYIRDSILLPDKHVAAGFAPVMPSYQGQLDEEDIRALIAYIASQRSAQ
ncbi:MAG TPA: cytochrome c oxidase subunit II [Steroidobacteraceae bacterium]|nr:cytochrome c oxidase subunit II [Steroidobacteraceae bacterium]